MDDDRTRDDLPTPSAGDGPAAPDDIDARSVPMAVDADGRPSRIRLRELDAEAPLPELEMGPGKYEILKRLGTGGMGTVYLAYDQDLNRCVALKMVKLASAEHVRDGRRRLTDAASRVVETLERTLEYEDRHPAARELLADYYWSRFQGAESAALAESEDVAFFAQRVQHYDDGKYAQQLQGDGSLRLRSEPDGAEVWLSELTAVGPCLAARNRRRLGTTPLAEAPLKMGSYLVELNKPGFRDTRYPVFISRSRRWSGAVKLRTEAELGPGYALVPPGPYIFGGDPEAWNRLPRSEPELGDFAIATFPVTVGEYRELLDHLIAEDGLGAAKQRAPRPAPNAPTFLPESADGRLTIPEVDPERDRWYPSTPAFGISFRDADAYCAWRSARDGRDYRLPSERGWEKAARGVDGRWFPWGWRFDPSLCNMRLSRKERATPVPVEEFPGDVSVYGVRGFAGNVREWTTTEDVEGVGSERRMHRINRGGGWGDEERSSRVASRYWTEPWWCSANMGFRLVLSLSGA